MPPSGGKKDIMSRTPNDDVNVSGLLNVTSAAIIYSNLKSIYISTDLKLQLYSSHMNQRILLWFQKMILDVVRLKLLGPMELFL